MDELESIQLLAFSFVAKARLNEPIPDPDYLFRHIFRWYSAKYSTPLHEVYSLPTFDILQAFYEDRYESMDDNDLEQERQELMKSDKDREAEAIERAREDVDGFEMAKEEEDTQTMSPIDKLVKEADSFKGALNKFKDKIPGLSKENVIEMGNVQTTLPPNIKMEFVESLDDLDSDSIGMLDPPKSR